MSLMNFTAPCHFGLESVLSGELKRMGALDVKADNGKVDFSGDETMMARANICLRTAERVMIKLKSFKATTFDQLFDATKSIPFEDYIGKSDAFPVKGWSLNSTLFSVRDCQSLIKKAAVDRLSSHYKQEWFAETGPTHLIRFSILKDEVSIMLDTSGVGLHKRGYRANANSAPIKETLAAGIVDLARVKDYSTVYDPLCGSGTLIIEAATKALNIPPCIRRKFAAQDWGVFNPRIWQDERTRGLDLVRKGTTFEGLASDIDPESVELAVANARKAGVLPKVIIKNLDVRDFKAREDMIVLCNPPYGERMLEKQEAQDIYKSMGEVFAPKNKASYYIITADEEFPKIFGRKALKMRKLYNGMIKCNLYMYY